MPSDRAFERFGSPDRFALELRLLPDPDGDAQAPASSTGSWGQWRLWVNGLNLTEHHLALAVRGVTRQQEVTWYLAPLMRWLAAVWTPLLHEEHFPSTVRRATDARTAYLSVAGTQMDDTEVFAPWQGWAARHSLRWAAEGGMIPDVFLRRVGDDIEISWGDRWQPGGEAAEYVIEPGVAHCDVVDVAAALDRALLWVASAETLRPNAWHKRFRRLVAARPKDAHAETPLAWYLDGKPRAGRLTRLFRDGLKDFGASERRWVKPEYADHAMTRLSPAAAMFGALSPTISPTAAASLLAIAAGSRDVSNVERPIERHARHSPAWQAIAPWEDGYRLALDLLDDLGLTERPGPFDLDGLLAEWQVVSRDEPLGQDGPLGVALAGPELAPTIIVNRDHLMNQHDNGRRFTKAHELCHLLFDRDRTRRIAHSSTQWAPLVVEQRANAFAAMLLMPPGAVRSAFTPRHRHPTRAEVSAMARELHVGLRAAIQHLANLGIITDEDRARLLDEAVEAGAFEPARRVSRYSVAD
jgi:Zn-dependent peptidase ImmA (M78 family)